MCFVAQMLPLNKRLIFFFLYSLFGRHIYWVFFLAIGFHCGKKSGDIVYSSLYSLVRVNSIECNRIRWVVLFKLHVWHPAIHLSCVPKFSRTCEFEVEKLKLKVLPMLEFIHLPDTC